MCLTQPNTGSQAQDIESNLKTKRKIQLKSVNSDSPIQSQVIEDSGVNA